ncbi:MAG: HDOD domain-containing protein [Kiritimatiellae bacterium]|nr:HDOD domain-containing protein [Kiritimatiellia bacterium]
MDEQTTQSPMEQKLRRVVGKITQLPALPDNVLKITRIIDNPHSTAEAVGREIAKDQALSAQVLKLVNSGFYGFSNPISSIPHATVLLGFNVMRSLVISTSAAGLISKSFPGLYEHSLACARTSYMLSRSLGLEEPEELSAIGLLHDIGKVVLTQYLKDECQAVFSLVSKENIGFYEAEQKVMGVTHVDIGRWLLEKWHLPPQSVEPIAMHHQFDPESEYRNRAAIVHLADLLVRAEGFGSGGDNRMPPVNHQALRFLDIGPGDLKMLMDEMVDQLYDIPRGQ